MVVVLYEKPIRIELDGTKLIVNGKEHPVSVRKLSEMRDVLRGNPDMELSGGQGMYYMYREVSGKGRIRYDITVIPAKVIDGECNKTYGHYHPIAEGRLTYPEVYQVLLGNAVFILQKPNRNGSVDAKIVKANSGDIVIIPPGYGHVTVNPEKEQALVLANLVSSSFSSDYSEYKANHGGAYYYLENGELAQNPQYIIRKTERVTAAEMKEKSGFPCNDLLKEFTENPEPFQFLEKPSMVFKKEA